MFKGLFDAGYKELKRVSKIADEIDALADKYKKFTDEELKGQTAIFRERLKNGETLDNILVEAFATVREASTRVLGMTPFYVQLEGALILHGGNVAEMKTGEGKTLTSTMVAYLNALPGEGVHIVTVNEYLASRDAVEMGKLFTWLGLTVGLNIRELSPEEKRAAYACDITYSTNNELGFDYLRDHMVVYKERMVQRPLNFAIVDEVDSVLVDEARTPLIISGAPKETSAIYTMVDAFVKALSEDDYDINIKDKIVTLNENGIEKAQRRFNIPNLYDLEHVDLVHRINNSLKANYAMANEQDYVVEDDQVIIVDQFTGRLMHGRQYSEGLHQAIEAKERVKIKDENKVVATITFQNYFRMYKKLAGMTGTAKTEEEEFREIYNMYVVDVPTNVPVVRVDDSDLIFLTTEAKYKALIEDVKERYMKGQPVLIGTISIDTNELISERLKKAHIPHQVLNARQHDREAEVIMKAGQLRAVTVATNMAGRGTDIKLGQGVRELGGLAVLGTERHESRRIDNQLRGRSGRQGDPGYTRFYLSCEDDLLRRFGGDRFKNMLSMLINQKDGSEKPIESKMMSKSVEGAQKKIEGSNYDSRKHVLEYDEVLRVQREVIYKQRTDILELEDISNIVLKMIRNSFESVVRTSLDEKGKNIDANRLFNFIDGKYFIRGIIKENDLQNKTAQEAVEFLYSKSVDLLNDKKEKIGDNVLNEVLKRILLTIVDKYWMDHIDAMSELRQSVRLQSYAQNNPLRAYREIGFEKFDDMVNNIEFETSQKVNTIGRIDFRVAEERQPIIKNLSFISSDTSTKKNPTKVDKKPGRNDPCPCGSGKKYKNCCGKF